MQPPSRPSGLDSQHLSISSSCVRPGRSGKRPSAASPALESRPFASGRWAPTFEGFGSCPARSRMERRGAAFSQPGIQPAAPAPATAISLPSGCRDSASCAGSAGDRTALLVFPRERGTRSRLARVIGYRVSIFESGRVMEFSRRKEASDQSSGSVLFHRRSIRARLGAERGRRGSDRIRQS